VTEARTAASIFFIEISEGVAPFRKALPKAGSFSIALLNRK
jgi:hypothetical protein